MSSNKREKAEDFIGWVSPDGLLKVTGIHSRGSRTLFKVICKICSQDPELFPDGYFASDKHFLKGGGKPCGCSAKPEWCEQQYLILASRMGDKKSFIVHGFVGTFKNQKSKLNCECKVDGHKWTPSVANVINQNNGCPKCVRKHGISSEEYLEEVRIVAKDKNFEVIGLSEEFNGYKTRVECRCLVDGHKWYPTISQLINLKTGCPKCAGNPRKTPEEAFKLCYDICLSEGYTPLDFVTPYKNKYSKFEYICHIPAHGKQKVALHHFVTNGTRCPFCAGERTNCNGYYEHRKDEQDYLYIMEFNDFIKIGRTFKLEDRTRSVKSSSKESFEFIHIYTGTHLNVYRAEQKVLSILRQKRLKHKVDWTNETFKKNSSGFALKHFEECGFDKIL